MSDRERWADLAWWEKAAVIVGAPCVFALWWYLWVLRGIYP